MNKNTYLGLALTACLSIASTSLLAEVGPADDINAPIPKFKEPLEPSEAQRQQAEQNKANITAPATSATEPLEPSKPTRHKTKHNKAKHDKAKTTAPEPSVTEPLEPSEPQK